MRGTTCTQTSLAVLLQHELDVQHKHDESCWASKHREVQRMQLPAAHLMQGSHLLCQGWTAHQFPAADDPAQLPRNKGPFAVLMHNVHQIDCLPSCCNLSSHKHNIVPARLLPRGTTCTVLFGCTAPGCPASSIELCAVPSWSAAHGMVPAYFSPSTMPTPACTRDASGSASCLPQVQATAAAQHLPHARGCRERAGPRL